MKTNLVPWYEMAEPKTCRNLQKLWIDHLNFKKLYDGFWLFKIALSLSFRAGLVMIFVERGASLMYLDTEKLYDGFWLLVSHPRPVSHRRCRRGKLGDLDPF